MCIPEERIKMKLHQIKSTVDEHFAEFWRIYSVSFPLNERRLIEQQNQILKRSDYHSEIYLLDDQVIGIIAFWTNKNFIFIEHFAIAPEVCGKKLGSTALRLFVETTEVPLILEIEPPEDELTYRRLIFYESSGFIRNSYIHFQPPYHKDDKPIKLEILSYATAISDDLYEQFAQFQKETMM